MCKIEWIYPILDNSKYPDYSEYINFNSISIPEILYDEEKVKDFDYYVNIIGKGDSPETDNEDSADDASYIDKDGNSESGHPYGLGNDTPLELALALRLQPILDKSSHDSKSGQDSDDNEVSFHFSTDDNIQTRQMSAEQETVLKYIVYQKELMKAIDSLRMHQYSYIDDDYEISFVVNIIRKFLNDYNHEWIQINRSKKKPQSHDASSKDNDPIDVSPSEEAESPTCDVLFREDCKYLFDNKKYAATMYELRRLLLNYRSNSSVKQQPPYNIYEELVRNISLIYATKIILCKCVMQAFGYTRNMPLINMVLGYEDDDSDYFELFDIVECLTEITRYHVASYLSGPSVKTHDFHMMVESFLSWNKTDLLGSKTLTLDYEKSMVAMRRFVNYIEQNAGNLVRYKVSAR